eukprot:1125832-Amphidinium_carterae.1
MEQLAVQNYSAFISNAKVAFHAHQTSDTNQIVSRRIAEKQVLPEYGRVATNKKRKFGNGPFMRAEVGTPELGKTDIWKVTQNVQTGLSSIQKNLDEIAGTLSPLQESMRSCQALAQDLSSRRAALRNVLQQERFLLDTSD